MLSALRSLLPWLPPSLAPRMGLLLLVAGVLPLGCDASLEEEGFPEKNPLKHRDAAPPDAALEAGPRDASTTADAEAGLHEAGKSEAGLHEAGEAGEAGTSEAGMDKPEAGPDRCHNEALDEGEPAIDCGAICAPTLCGVGTACGDDGDCASGTCDGVCVSVSCTNRRLDDGESDVDCGGVCPKPCADGRDCQRDVDCRSRICDADEMCAEPRCDDSKQNGDEAGIDCGAKSGCGLCENGDACLSGADCVSDACVSDICAPATCDDDVKNGTESDEDCGGECPACGDLLKCKRHMDCSSGRCENDGEGNLLCQEPSCEDEVLNGAESDEDCGGTCDLRCELGKRCNTADDCAEHACGHEEGSELLTCRPPSCVDETKNGVESGIDCGGDDCDVCEDGETCNEHGDCESNSCDVVCLGESCEDGRKNLDETTADCGGEQCAKRCGVDDVCVVDGDCLSEVCTEGVCTPGGAGAGCRGDGGCLSQQCADDICLPSGAGMPCKGDGDCSTSKCGDENSCEQSFTGDACADDLDCYSGECNADGCGPGITGDECEEANDCASTRCVSEVCAAQDLVLQSNGTFNGTTEIAVEFTLAAGPAAVAWADLAVLYFFNYANPATAKEVAHVDMGQHYQSGGAAAQSCVGVNETDWIFVWQSHNSGNVGSEWRYTIKLNNHVGSVNQPIDPTNDYSYRAGTGATTKLVICRKVGARWYLVQGTPPETIADPCQYVVPDCTAVTCDSL